MSETAILNYSESPKFDQRRLDALRSSISEYRGRVGHAQSIIDEAERNIVMADLESVRLERATALLLSLADDYQSKVVKFLAGIVTQGIRDVFGTDWSVEFVESVRGLQKTIDIELVIDEERIAVPDGCGGGVTQVIGVLTQIAIVFLLRGQVGQVVVLDESLSHLSDVYVPSAASVLKAVARRLDIQIILVSHQPDLVDVADVVYEMDTETPVVTRRG